MSHKKTKLGAIQVPVAQKGPRFAISDTRQSQVWREYCLKENGEGPLGAAQRAAQERIQDALAYESKHGVGAPRPPQMDIDAINTRVGNPTSREVAAMAKARNSGHGNLWDHAGMTGEAGLLG